MIDGPHTTKEAAMRLLLGEMGPLLDRAESAAHLLQEGHRVLERDMVNLGMLVSRVETVLQESLDDAHELLQETKRLRTDPGAPKHKAIATGVPAKFPVASVLACGVLSAVLAVGGMAVFNANTIEHARVGRAVANALQYMDPATRQKLESAIQKASS